MDAEVSFGQDVVTEPEVPKFTVDLSLICAAIHHGCMGLPQELVDDIMNMIHDDLQALKACSLTCKAMFASTRCLIHQTLHVTQRNGNSVSYPGESDIHRYVRQVHIATFDPFAPSTLQPHLCHFQSLDQVHTLTVDRIPANTWGDHTTYSTHFYPTLTSLRLYNPNGHLQLLLQFILQFPNLDNLCLERLSDLWGGISDIPDTVDQLPPLRGHLRLARLSNGGRGVMDFAYKPGNSINFRSVELDDDFGDHTGAQRILDACAGTLESLTLIPCGIGESKMKGFTFSKLAVLRRLTISPLLYYASSGLRFLSIPTITSPVFRELVLEMNNLWPRNLPPVDVHNWEGVDGLLAHKFAGHENFRLVFTFTGGLRSQGWKRYLLENFPLSASRGWIHFEQKSTIDGYRRRFI